MPNYLATGNVKVFPSTRRVGTQVDARLITEASMVGLINQLIDKEGFVISDSYTSGSAFEFNIFGYYFQIADASTIPTAAGASSGSIWAKITIDNSGYHELVGQDDGTNYTGLELVTSEPTSSATVKKLLLLTKSGNTWVIPDQSKLMFGQDRLDIIDIDGGVIS